MATLKRGFEGVNRSLSGNREEETGDQMLKSKGWDPGFSTLQLCDPGQIISRPQASVTASA